MTETKSLAAALAAFQAEMPTVSKDRTAKVGTYSYTYAGLADVMHAAIPLLTKHGLSFSCCPRRSPQGDYDLVGILLHESGETLEGCLPIQGTKAQEIGSSLTYGRRYLFGCITGLVTDDDDDGALANNSTRRAQRKPPAEPWPEARTVSQAQVNLMGTLMSKLGMTDRTLALAYVKDVIGREVASRNDLTVNEAAQVIESLKNDERATA
ncbi:MAG TPA: ERF family protein [Acidimicrobiales bacterium]|nr:ERF family protein [Acidimicrobiales bacterium]